MNDLVNNNLQFRATSLPGRLCQRAAQWQTSYARLTQSNLLAVSLPSS